MNLEQFKLELENDVVLKGLEEKLQEALADWKAERDKREQEIKTLRAESKVCYKEREKLLLKAQTRDRMIEALRNRIRTKPTPVRLLEHRIRGRKMQNINKLKRAAALAAGLAAMQALKIK